MLIPLSRSGQDRHWLTRAKKNTSWRVLKHLGPNDELVEMEVSHQARTKDPTLPATFLARAIRYQRKGLPPQTLLTALLDADRYPAAEMAGLYHERWELELGYDEIKTEMLEREEPIRSRSPAAVAQELWGILLAYNLVRLEMERVADEAGVEPTASLSSPPFTSCATSGSGARSPRLGRSPNTSATCACSSHASSCRCAGSDRIRAQ